MRHKVLLINSSFYQGIASLTLEAAIRVVEEHGMEYDKFSVHGSMEIPYAMRIILSERSYDGVIVLGCIIKGETDHYEVVKNACCTGVEAVGLEYLMPVGFGIITATQIEQAEARANLYGANAAKACIQLIRLREDLNDSGNAYN